MAFFRGSATRSEALYSVEARVVGFSRPIPPKRVGKARRSLIKLLGGSLLLPTTQTTTRTTAAEKCSICNQNIVDGKDQAVFCESDAGCITTKHDVAVTYFESLSSSNKPFFCNSCVHSKHTTNIAEMKEMLVLITL